MWWRGTKECRVQRPSSHGLGCVRDAGGKRRNRKQDPSGKWTYDNIDAMRTQQKRMGNSATLEQGNRHLQTGILPVEQWLF
jgi:hypothetical protein